jgi:class 3 adenylate cyclase
MQSSPTARFCSDCGARLTQARQSAEYKQVTVLFADVVHSMNIAATVGAERLREIMAELTDRCAAVVTRFGGTVGSFTGDGIMAVFGAPLALEDHAVRACLAGLAIQEEAKQLAVDVHGCDGVELQLRVGLNSGQVIAGEIGSGQLGYTTIGEQVGMAQRMESVAPVGGVMLSASTARLVEATANLGERELVQIKGAGEPVAAHRLMGMAEHRRTGRRTESNLVGRRWEMSAIEGILDRAIDGHGAVVGIVGPPGIGKSRLVQEVSTIASSRGVTVFTTCCESHTSQVPFHAIARLLRATVGVAELDPPAARALVRTQFSDADPEDLVLFDDLLGIRDPETEPPRIDPDARRRRLTALVGAASLASRNPVVYVIEDAHWIDPVSESMLSDLLIVVPPTSSLVLVTYRPEYVGALTRPHASQTIALAPLSDPEIAALLSGLLGPDPSITELGHKVAERAAGNPFFAEEIVWDLAERRVLLGDPGAYVSNASAAEVSVPATLQATISARIDRLDPGAKRTLGAAAVIGSRFSAGLVETLGIDPVVEDLVCGEFIDQITFTQEPDYVFHHPLIRAVAYESQLRSDRAELHRRVASAIESRNPAGADENAALIAEHLEAAGDLHAAYSWHMRAGAWSITRDIAAAIGSWERACQLADKLPKGGRNAAAMRVSPRALLCANAFRVHRGASAARFPELQQWCEAAEDKASLAIGMAGLLADTLDQGEVGEASQLASEHLKLLEAVNDPALTVGLSFIGIIIKALSAEMQAVLQWSQSTIELAEGHPTKGSHVLNSPLALALGTRAVARYSLGIPGWYDDLDRAFSYARTADAMSHATLIVYKYDLAVAGGVLPADDTALREIGLAVQKCERSGDDFALAQARMSMGFALIHHDAADSDCGVALLEQVREHILQGGFSLAELPLIDMYIGRQQARRGDTDGVLTSMREAVEQLFSARHWGYVLPATSFLVETLVESDSSDALSEADTAIDRLATSVAEHQPIRYIMVLRLRTLVARHRGDEAEYGKLARRYRAMAGSLGYKGHMKWAEAMP